MNLNVHIELLISEQLEKGNQVLYLLPEIALTTQIINRLKNILVIKLGFIIHILIILKE